MADQDQRAPARDVVPPLIVDLGDKRAGRIERGQAAIARLIDHRARHAVGAENGDRAVRNLAELLDEMRALGDQAVDDMAVVHDLMAHIDRRPVLLQGQLDNIDGAHHARTETARLGQDDPQAVTDRVLQHSFPYSVPASCAEMYGMRACRRSS